MSARPLLTTAALLAVGLLNVHCEEGKPPSGPGGLGVEGDACFDDSGCNEGLTCEDFVCTAGEDVNTEPCVSNDECNDGFVCNTLNGQCVPSGGGDGGGDGGDGGDGGGDGGQDGSCTTKYECNDGQICRGNRCVAPGSVCNTDDDCPRSKLCSFAKVCEDGCTDARDCADPQLCHPKKFVCESCSISNPCPAGKSCVAGACQEVVSCSTTAQCVSGGADGTVCIGSSCTNCSTHEDCNTAPYNSENPPRLCAVDGLCKSVTCDNESCQEQLGTELAYCDTSANPPNCSTRQCVTNADCPQAGSVCDTYSFTCVNESACTGEALSTCDMECQMMGAVCNPADCTCSGGTADDPFMGMMACMSAPDPMICFLESGIGGCATIGLTAPGLLGLAFLLRRRRRQA